MGSRSRLTGWAPQLVGGLGDDARDQAGQVDRLAPELDDAPVELVQIEQAGEDAVQPAGVGGEPAQQVLGVGRAQPAAAPLQGQGDAEHRGQRGAQVVGDGLEEAALELVEGAQVLGRGPLAVEGHGQAVGGHQLGVEGGAQLLLDLAPLGDVPGHHQVAAGLALALGQGRDGQVVDAAVPGDLRSRVACSTPAAMAAATVSVQVGSSWPTGWPTTSGRRQPGQPAGGRVGVQHPPVRVEHQHRVADRPEDLAAGHRPQVEQAELVDAPDQDRRGQHEGERGQVDLPERLDPQVEQEVEHDRQQDGPDQQRRSGRDRASTSG